MLTTMKTKKRNSSPISQEESPGVNKQPLGLIVLIV